MDAFDFTTSDAIFDFVGGTSSSGNGGGGAGGASGNDPRTQPYHPLRHNPAWSSLGLDDLDRFDTHAMSQQRQPSQSVMPSPASSQQQLQQQQQQQQQQPHLHPSPMSHTVSRPGSNHSNQPMAMPATGLDFDYNNVLGGAWQYQMSHGARQTQSAEPRPHPQQHFPMGSLTPNPFHGAAVFPAQLQPSAMDLIPSTTVGGAYAVTAGMTAGPFMTMAGPMESMQALSYPLHDYQGDVHFPMALNTATLTQHLLNQQQARSSRSSISSSSPAGTILEVQSVSDNEWSMVNVNPNRHSYDSYGTVSNPSQNLHIRTNSDSSSDGPHSAGLSGSYEEIHPWPISSPHDFHGSDYLDAQYIQQQTQNLPSTSEETKEQRSPSSLAVSPRVNTSPKSRSSGVSSTSPTSSGSNSPPLRRRKSPPGPKTTKAVIKKTNASTARKDVVAEKKIGRRKGPLRPDQRQQAHEIRKLRACLRCKFLKKTCDKGEPCGGCRPSHARLWQVPCTRMDIKDIAYFMKDWRADYERHSTLAFSVSNIQGFGDTERTLYITHGYGHYLPISAREVFVRDEECFGVDWVESIHLPPLEFEVDTARLAAGIEGVSSTLLSEYLDCHLDETFESFVDEYFEGTFFLTEILKTAYRYYTKEKTPSMRKALKLVIAYNLTQHVTMIEKLSDADEDPGHIEERSRFAGKTAAPVMINFQVKCALADMWRELQKDILEELSALYSSVYSGDKLKNWPTIFMLATILLAIWEEMQFDCHYRIPDEKAVEKFCDDMETTPVGVIVGLFQAISTKLPGIQEWDTRKHHHLLFSNPAVCDALTEFRGHVNKYESYLRERSSAKFDRDDFDCLSNKFLSKLVIRAN